MQIINFDIRNPSCGTDHHPTLFLPVQVCPPEGTEHAPDAGAGGQAAEIADAKSRALRQGTVRGRREARVG